MTNNELSELAAITRGWRLGTTDVPFLGQKWFPPKGDSRQYYPNYAEDYNAAHELLDEVRRRGWEGAFGQILIDMLCLTEELPLYQNICVFYCCYATPRQITIAALAALKVKTLKEMMTDASEWAQEKAAGIKLLGERE